MPALTLREVRPEDAAILREIDVRVVEDGRGVVRLPRDVRDLSAFADNIRSMLGSEDKHFLVAEYDGIVAGEGTVRRYPVSLCRHVALLALQVDPRYQGKGVGRAIAEALVQWSDARGISRLELNVRGDNTRAIALYRSLGFSIEGTRQAFIAPPGIPAVDDHSMVRWSDAPALERLAVVVQDGGQIVATTDPLRGLSLPVAPLSGGDLFESARAIVLSMTGLSIREPVASLGSWTRLDPDRRLVRWHAVSALASGDGRKGSCVLIPSVGIEALLPCEMREILSRASATGRERS